MRPGWGWAYPGGWWRPGGLVAPESLARVRAPAGVRWSGADDIRPDDSGVRHDGFSAGRPADPTARVRTGGAAAAFFAGHLG
ncbi:hypothetical protein ACH4OX_15310 [Streptomyces roseolus]|uniref:hypothetical protein n=1 Tax=Streptomyces roseolus TaxID=67358 RepID=UPI0037B6891B